MEEQLFRAHPELGVDSTDGAQRWVGKIRGNAAELVLLRDKSVTLTNEGSLLSCFGSRSCTISPDDLVGATLDGTHSVQIWYMPITKPRSERPVRRLCKTPAIRLSSEDEAKAAVNAIRSSVCQFPIRLRVIINPTSGRGKAASIFRKKVKPVLEAAGTSFIAYETERRCHATQILKSTQPEEVDVILSLGGDGTMFEVLQGVLQRTDWELFSQVPLVQIPCGSGNALAANAGLWNVPTAVHAALKGTIAPLDVASIIQPGEGSKNPCRFFSFLSVTYGMISTLDVGSEHLRFLGSFRFTVGAIDQLLKQPTYKMKVAYMEAANRDAEIALAKEIEEATAASVEAAEAAAAKKMKKERAKAIAQAERNAAWKVILDECHEEAKHTPHGNRPIGGVEEFLEQKLPPMPLDEDVDEAIPPAEGENDAQQSTGDAEDIFQWSQATKTIGFGPALRYFETFLPVAVTRTGGLLESEYSEESSAITDSNGASTSSAASATAVAPVEATASTSSTNTAPAGELGSGQSGEVTLPPRWHWMPTEEIQLFAACNLPYLSMESFFAPQNEPHSGHFELIYTAGRGGFKKGAEIFIASEKGKHMDLVEHHKIRAMWLEPQSEGVTWVTVDGEAVPHRPLYTEVHKGLCRILVPPKRSLL